MRRFASKVLTPLVFGLAASCEDVALPFRKRGQDEMGYALQFGLQ
jgi:hypothetical protein